MKKGSFIFITTIGRAWFGWFGGWRRNGAMAWAPPPFMRENLTSSDLSVFTYKSITNRYQYRFVIDLYEFIDFFSIYYRFDFDLLQTTWSNRCKAVYQYKIVYKPVISLCSAIFLI